MSPRATRRAKIPSVDRDAWRLRKRLAGFVLLVGALLVGAFLMKSQASLAHVEIRYRLGDPPRARRIEVLIVPQGGSEPVARFASELIRPEMVEKPRLKTGLYRLDISLDGNDGVAHPVVRTIDARADAVISVDLGDVPR